MVILEDVELKIVSIRPSLAFAIPVIVNAPPALAILRNEHTGIERLFCSPEVIVSSYIGVRMRSEVIPATLISARESSTLK
jgi:hypothetical protein